MVDDQGLPVQTDCDARGPTSVAYRTSRGTVFDTIERFQGFSNCLVRNVQFQNDGKSRCDVTGATLRIMPVSAGSEATWQAQSFAMTECAPGGPTLCVAFTSDADTFHTQWKTGGAIEHQSNSAWRLNQGQTATIGKQYIWIVDGDLSQARGSAQAWYDAVGLTVADGGPDWFHDVVLYQASAGGSVDSRFGDVGGFDNFTRQLDYIADLGCNAFWLMSVHTHKDPAHPLRGWNLYSPMNYDEVDPAYGGASELTSLVAQMHRRGFHVLGEIVPHGGTAALSASHPDWWTYGRDGKRVRLFGQSPDYSNSGWQAAIGNSIKQLTSQFGFEGYRVDVAPGFGINWNSSLNAPHVSRSTMGGAIGMLRAIREGAVAGGAKQPAIIPESMETPEYARYGPIGYGFPLIRFLEQNPPAALPPAELQRRLRDFFEHEQGSLPRGMIVLRTLNNHDTVVDHGRADRRFGIGLQRALTAVCTVVEGVPMIYQEQEVGSYDYFRRLFWARRHLPELCRGSADYGAIHTTPQVFSVLRTLKASHVAALINLSSEPITTDVQVSVMAKSSGPLTLVDAISQRSVTSTNGRFRWTFEPFATAIFRLEERAPCEPPPERHRVVLPRRDQQTQFSCSRTQDGISLAYGTVTCRAVSTGNELSCDQLPNGSIRITVNTDRLPPEGFSLSFAGVGRWKVQSVTGDYTDHLLRRQYPWPNDRFPWQTNQVWGHEPHTLYRGVLPLGRVWQSAVAPLADNGEVCLAGPSGSGLWLQDITSSVENIVLADSAADSNLPQDGMKLTFFNSDPALNPHWLPPWQSTGWLIEVPYIRHELSAPLTFTIGAMDDVQRQVAPVKLWSASHSAEPIIGPGKHHFFANRLWLEEPNSVTFPPVTFSSEGPYWLWVQLRQSERSGTDTELTDHYQLLRDGKTVPFTWQKLNVFHTGNGYFGWAKFSLGKLRPGPHRFKLQTTHSWCAAGRPMFLTTDAMYIPQ